MLGQNIQPAGLGRIPVQVMPADPFDGRAAFQHLEAVARDQQGLGRGIKPMVGPPDALQQARDTLGRANLYHEVYRTPVDAQVER